MVPLLDKLHNKLDTVHSGRQASAAQGAKGRPPQAPLPSRLSQQSPKSDPDRPPSPRSIHLG